MGIRLGPGKILVAVPNFPDSDLPNFAGQFLEGVDVKVGDVGLGVHIEERRPGPAVCSVVPIVLKNAIVGAVCFRRHSEDPHVRRKVLVIVLVKKRPGSVIRDP